MAVGFSCAKSSRRPCKSRTISGFSGAGGHRRRCHRSAGTPGESRDSFRPTARTLLIITIFTGSTIMHSLLPKCLAAAAVLCLIAATAAKADPVTVGWNANADPTNSYKVYYGSTSGVYDSSEDAHHQTQQTIYGFKLGHTYYFAVVAYNE